MLLIFATLRRVRDFAACEGVCRAWRRLLPDCQPDTIVVSRHQPLQTLIWLAAHSKLVRNVKTFVIKDDIADAGVEVSNLLHLAFKYGRGLTQLRLEIPVGDSCSVHIAQCTSCAGGHCNADAYFSDMQELPEDALEALANVPPTLRTLKCKCGNLSGAEWETIPQEVQLKHLVINKLELAALDHLSDATHIWCNVIDEAAAHLHTKVPHLRTLYAAHVPKDMVMRLSFMPDLEKLVIKNGEESVIDLSKGFPALKQFTFRGKCKKFSAPRLHAASIDVQIS